MVGENQDCWGHCADSGKKIFGQKYMTSNSSGTLLVVPALREPLGFQVRQDDGQHRLGLGQGLLQSCCSSAPEKGNRSQMRSIIRQSQKAGTPKPSHRKPSKRHPTNNRGKRSAEPVSTNNVIIGRIFLNSGDSLCSSSFLCLKCNMPLAEQNIHSYPAVGQQATKPRTHPKLRNVD